MVALFQVQAHAVNDDVVQVQGALVGDGPSNLSLQEGGGGLQRLAVLGVSVDQLKQVLGLSAVTRKQVVNAGQGPAVGAGNLAGAGGDLVQARSTHQGQALGAGGVYLGLLHAEGEVDGVGSHHAVGGQLTAGDGG